jgi:hypothetical protein
MSARYPVMRLLRSSVCLWRPRDEGYHYNYSEEPNMQTSMCILPAPERKQNNRMGLTHVTVRIANPTDSKRYRDVEF